MVGFIVCVPAGCLWAWSYWASAWRAITASWNKEQFSQGSPKPDGSKPGLTKSVTGTYDPKTGEFTLEWASEIEGGPFNGFTGVWHWEGTFEKK